MAYFLRPITNELNQDINPWTWFTKLVGGQFGLININLGKSTDPVLEQQILDDVGSYGRQLGQMGDALEEPGRSGLVTGWTPGQRRLGGGMTDADLGQCTG